MPIDLDINPDRTYKLEIRTPASNWMLLHAAGVRRASLDPKIEICGKLTVKHVYEIARIKRQDNWLKGINSMYFYKEGPLDIIQTLFSLIISFYHYLGKILKIFCNFRPFRHTDLKQTTGVKLPGGRILGLEGSAKCGLQKAGRNVRGFFQISVLIANNL